ncbi:hypothetical protein D3C73_1123900 [compost metagenome]
MQTFKDADTGQFWQFEDDVTVQEVAGGRIFVSPHIGQLTGVPLTLEPAEYVEPEPGVLVPQIVSRFQGREAMWQTSHGETTLFEAAEVIIDHSDTPAMYKRAWADLQEFRRDSEMLQDIAALLGLTSANLDALFILAAGIEA